MWQHAARRQLRTSDSGYVSICSLVPDCLELRRKAFVALAMVVASLAYVGVAYGAARRAGATGELRRCAVLRLYRRAVRPARS
jgi:hypothetical protein